MFSKRKGFTLVELLIVIIVIGILAGGMMLASGAATDSAKASTLVADLRNAKAGGVMWFGDNVGVEEPTLLTTWQNAGTMQSIFKDKRYMDNPAKIDELNFVVVSGVSALADGCYIGKATSEPKVAGKVWGQAKGVLFTNGGISFAAEPTAATTFYMRVR